MSPSQDKIRPPVPENFPARSWRTLIELIRSGELLRYGTVTVAGYAILYAGTYLLVEGVGLSPRTAYPIVLTLVYVGVYISYGMFVFRERFTQRTFRRFMVVLVVIWLLNNGFFYLLNEVFAIHYLVVITLNILLFGGVRFWLQRFYVFKSS